MFIGVVINVELKKIDCKNDYPREKEAVIVYYLDENGILTSKRFLLSGLPDAQYYHIGDIVEINGDIIEHLDIRKMVSNVSKIKRLKEAIGESHPSTLETKTSDRTDLAYAGLDKALKTAGSMESHKFSRI